MQEKPICIIPARGGSKRVPRKNIIEFNGKPLIAWPIGTAIASNLFSRVIVSTEDKEIADISREYGAEVPFIRAAELADDFATTAQVLKDTLTKIPTTGYAYCLYPTAPLVTVENLINAYDQICNTAASCVLSVCDYDFHPLRAFTKDKNDYLGFHWSEHELSRSQDLPEMIHDAGAFYFFEVASILKNGKLIGDKTAGTYLTKLQAVDIDTREDLEFARILHRFQLERLNKPS